MNTLSCEALPLAALGEPVTPLRPLRVPQVQRAPDEFGDLPDELPDASVGWTENPEHAQ